MIDKLVIYTNASIQPLLEKFEDLLEDSDKYPHFKLVDRIDMKAFIGILYLRAAFRLNLLDREIIWNHESAHDMFGATMSVKRFKFICRFGTFDDKTTGQDRWKNDKFACMREIFEAMNSRNASMRCPSALLAVNETLYPYRGHIGFKQYNPQKPAKYGLLYRSPCDSTGWLTLAVTLPFKGATFRWTATSRRFFLAEWALQKKFTIVGTMHHDRKGIPKEVKAIGNREEKSVLYVYHKEKNIMLASYIDKKKSGKKNVIVLSTMHDSVKVTNDQRKKPQIHSMYGHPKGGVDVVDLLST